MRPRLLVLTDITSVEAGVREPDDAQSMIRLMLYSNAFRIEGLVAGSNLGHGRIVRPGLIHGIIDAYGMVREPLLRHEPGYPAADALHAVVRAGQPVADPRVDVWASIGDGKDTPASDLIIEAVDRDDPEPLRIAVWGGTADLAQALYRVRKDRGPDGARDFARRIRVHSIGDQDSTGPWIRTEFPDLRYIRRELGYRGMYRGGDASFASDSWVRENVCLGHGPLGAVYPNYDGGDIWSGTLGGVRGVKEGDTPSYLGLVPNGLNIPDHPEWGGWGGRLGFDPVFGCLSDAQLPEGMGDPNDPDPRMVDVYRWRPYFQADFAARLDWCVRPPGEANHAPKAKVCVDGGIGRGQEGYDWVSVAVSPGAVVEMDATGSFDPDGNGLRYSWDTNPLNPPFSKPFTTAHGPGLRLSVPEDARSGDEYHVLLTVTDDGVPPLSSWKRVVVCVRQ